MNETCRYGPASAPAAKRYVRHEMKTTIAVTMTADDVRKAMFLNMKPRPPFMIVGGILGAVWITVLVLMVRDFLKHGTYAFSLAILTLSTLYLVLSPLVYFPWRAKRTFLQQKMLHDEIIYELDDNGLSARSKWGSNEIPWNTFHKVKFNNELILLYHSDYLFTMIPRRAVASDADFTTLSNDIVSRIRKG